MTQNGRIELKALFIGAVSCRGLSVKDCNKKISYRSLGRGREKLGIVKLFFVTLYMQAVPERFGASLSLLLTL